MKLIIITAAFLLGLAAGCYTLVLWAVKPKETLERRNERLGRDEKPFQRVHLTAVAG